MLRICRPQPRLLHLKAPSTSYWQEPLLQISSSAVEDLRESDSCMFLKLAMNLWFSTRGQSRRYFLFVGKWAAKCLEVFGLRDIQGLVAVSRALVNGAIEYENVKRRWAKKLLRRRSRSCLLRGK